MTTTQTLNQYNPKDLTIAVTGDIHIGHAITSTSKILKSLLSIVPDSEESSKIDLLVLNGDVFDNPLMLSSEYRSEIIITFLQLLKRCKKYDITLRVLEGTPSHDYKQGKIIEELNEEIKADCKYIGNLSIEHNKKYNSYWLFVPDEWRATSEQTYNEVKELLSANGIAKVDYAFMHGYFGYQLPEIANEEAHDVDLYHDIVENDIFINHVHLFSQKGRITAPGSIERLAHNEEGDKGWVLRTAKGIEFIINKDSTKYTTVVCTGLELEKAHKKVNKVAEALVDGSCVRIKANKDDSIMMSLSFFKTEYPKINWSTVKADKKDSKTVMDTPEIKTITRIPTITKENISSFIYPRLKEKNPSIADTCLELLEEVINGTG